MTKYFCDRCEKEAEEGKNIAVLEPYTSNSLGKTRNTIEHEYCLCDECLLKIFRWIQKKEELN